MYALSSGSATTAVISDEGVGDAITVTKFSPSMRSRQRYFLFIAAMAVVVLRKGARTVGPTKLEMRGAYWIAALVVLIGGDSVVKTLQAGDLVDIGKEGALAMTIK